MVLRGSFGIKDRKMTVSCSNCRGSIDVPIIEMERLKEIVCPYCGLSFNVEAEESEKKC